MRLYSIGNFIGVKTRLFLCQFRVKIVPMQSCAAESGAPGLPEPLLPGGATRPKAFPAAPIRHGGERAGNIFAGRAGSEQDFSRADEETPVLSASQAALVIVDARGRQGSRI